ncbi:hypothetical protein EB234_29605 [Mesorhizobium japonicum R7A]|uniref:Uncharacterized protein n=1 Tax=Mesorhizobium loti R88b TaxID=935548 RepID=A0A6M7X2F2_RHILI|nr:hypothetical protein EB234_29605 [Mesorhizobium japonicum R7A]QKD05651.1 hypothetical protein EB235_32665 [Mesorhizobium loti R88b]
MIGINLDSETAGRRAIAGFLLQILRSIKLGLDMTLTLSPLADGTQMVLHLEPAEGSDHQVVGGASDIVEQVKMRASRRKWTSGEIASKVFPDLLKAVKLAADQQFRFVTNNAEGLAPLQAYIASRGKSSERQHRWGNARLTTIAFEQRLAEAAGLIKVNAELRHLLDRFEIEIIAADVTQDAIDKALTPLLRKDEVASDKRFQLLGQLMTLATDGAKLTPAELLTLINPQAHRLLAHIQSLPALLARHVDEDAQLIGYVPSQQARLALPKLVSNFAILSGESGQGKTWTLAQLAFDQIARGELAIVMRSPTKIEDVVNCISERIWQPAHPDRGTIAVVAKVLGDAFRDENGNWLTVYIDDVQDREFAQRLARSKWDEYGVRIVVSAQPRITNVIRSIREGVQIIEIGNFRSADLHRFLRHHDLAEALETMPDDVFELLLKPVHASIFVQLPKRASWAGVSEYELFSAYWEYASLRAREQSDHPTDKYALRSLAARLLTGKGYYPWRVTDLHAVNLDDHAVLRLEQVGLLRRPVPDRFLFAADRMLNWAIAESLADNIQEDELSAEQAEALFASIDGLQTKKKEPIGSRLGYVYFDALWLLARQSEPEFVADLIQEHVARLPEDTHSEDQWRNGYGSLGGAILSALEVLTLGTFDERDLGILRNVPHALAAVAASDPGPVGDLIARQVASPNEVAVDIGLRAACLVQAPAALTAIWDEHLKRALAYEQARLASDVDTRSQAIFAQQLSSEALHVAISANPGWLDPKLATETNEIAVSQLLWMLKDEKTVDSDLAAEIWERHRERIVALMPTPSAALIEAIGHFQEASLLPMLDAAPSSGEWTHARVLRSRARVAPHEAIRQIAEGTDSYGWGAANWWFDELAAVDPDGLAAAIRARAHAGDDPLTDTVLYYGFNPEAMDARTLDEVLDAFAEKLRVFSESNANTDAHEGRLHHPLNFLPRLSERWQFEALRRRSGTKLEKELVQFAAARRGRISMTRDNTGNECERILAMIGGSGYDDLVLAELSRPNVFGRQDGFIAARWTNDDRVAAALAKSPGDPENQTFDQVVRMEALAVHCCDEQLEAMVRAGTPIYVNAVGMRCSIDRDMSGLRTRIADLLASGDIESLDIAAALTGFLGGAEEAQPLVAIYLAPATKQQTRHRTLASFRALHFYTPELLPIARDMIAERIDDEAQFVATYLAEVGDDGARQAVIDWLSSQDLGSASASRRRYLTALVEHPSGKAAVVEYLQRSRANGHLVVDGGQLRLLAEAGDGWAQEQLVRASYRYSGFDRGNVIAAIDYLRKEEPDEAYFAAQRLLSRHAVAVAGDLMLEINPDRAGPELIERYRHAKPSLRLQLERRLRAHLGGNVLAALVTPLASALPAADRKTAAQLAAVVPPGEALPWLDRLARDSSPAVQQAARMALRQRRLETTAMAHRDLLLSSPKPLQWARLLTILELVDPFYLWARDDPANLSEVFDALPFEFLHEGRQLGKKQLKRREDAAAKADKDH